MGQEPLNLKNPIGQDEFEEFLYMLDSMFDGDFTNSESKAHKKAALTFKNMKRRDWTIEEFRWTMIHLEKKWEKSFWMPADILNIHAMLYGDDRLYDNFELKDLKNND